MNLQQLIQNNARTALILWAFTQADPQTAPKVFECFTPGEEQSYMYAPVEEATPLFEEGVDSHQAATLWQLVQDGTGILYDVQPNQLCGVRDK